MMNNLAIVLFADRAKKWVFLAIWVQAYHPGLVFVEAGWKLYFRWGIAGDFLAHLDNNNSFNKSITAAGIDIKGLKIRDHG